VKWWVRVLVVLGVVATSGVTAAFAQEASPVASPAAEGRPLDLAAMALQPADLAEPGFGTGWSELADAASLAEHLALDVDVPVTEILTGLNDAGYLRRYELWLERGYPQDVATPEAPPGIVEKRVVSAVTEYATAEGAAAGFALIERGLEDQAAVQEIGPRTTPYEDVPLTTEIGDEAEATRYGHITPDTGVPVQNLNLTVRVGNLIADVIVEDHRNNPPDVAEAEVLAATLLARIEAVQTDGAPGLSNLVIRPTGESQVDTYLARDGRAIPIFGESPAQAEASRQSIGNATDVYGVERVLGEFPYLLARLYRFPSAEDAASWLTEQPELTIAVPNTGYVDVTEVADAETLGEASRVFRYGFPLDATTTAYGYAVYARVGDIVARVQVDSVPEAPLASVLELAQAQVRCLQAGSCLETIPVPAALVESVATPEAATVATPAA
jgi:hypothetical protein